MDEFKVVVPAPVKLMLPVRTKFPFIVTGVVPEVETVIPVFTVTGPNVSAFPWMVWLAVVEKVVIPVPEMEKVPLLVIPALNSKGAFPEEVRDPVPEMVGSPVNNFSPVAPEKASAPLIVEVVVTVNAAVLLFVMVIPEEMERF